MLHIVWGVTEDDSRLGHSLPVVIRADASGVSPFNEGLGVSLVVRALPGMPKHAVTRRNLRQSDAHHTSKHRPLWTPSRPLQTPLDPF
eukprot:4473485-Pyramimonas_sp.AAC.1